MEWVIVGIVIVAIIVVILVTGHPMHPPICPRCGRAYLELKQIENTIVWRCHNCGFWRASEP